MTLLKKIFTKTTDSEIVSILDIGSSKIICLIAKIDKNNNFEIIGSGCCSANGFKNCTISNSRIAQISIISAIEQAEKNVDMIIENVVLVLNGNKISSHYLKNAIRLKKQKITEYDIDKLILHGITKLQKDALEVIHYSPLEYYVDGHSDINDPCGLLGQQLAAKIHYVTIPSLLLANIVTCLAECHINVIDCIFAPHSSGLAVLNKNEQEMGTTIIDFGTGVTSFALFSQSKLLNCGYIPIGGQSLTHDIAKSFMLDLTNAERIKTIHGSANITYADTYKMIKTNDNSLTGLLDTEIRNISNAELNEVINARVSEIFHLLKTVLGKQYKLFPNAKNDVILTGGGSALTGIAHEASKILETKTRIKKPNILSGLKADIPISSYSSAIGALQYFLNNASKHKVNNISPWQKLTGWLKHHF